MRSLVQGENDLASVKPELVEDWDFNKNDGKTPSMVFAFSNNYADWECHKCGYEWSAKISNRSHGRGCPCCSNKVTVPGKNDLKTANPELAKEWDYEKNEDLIPEMFTPGNGTKVFWKCPKGHSYQASILHRSYGTNCPVCNSGRQTSFAEQTVYYYVKKLYPDAINRYKADFLGRMELDIYIPSIQYAIEYDGAAWHKKDKTEREIRKWKLCRENGIKLIRLKEQEHSSKCVAADMEFCKENLYEHRNLEFILDSLLAKLDFKVFWHTVDINIERDQYEIRNYAQELKGETFESMFPDLAKEWNHNKNGALKPSMIKPHSDIMVYWTCPDCGKEYRATPAHRSYGTGCPICGIKKSAMAKSISVDMIDYETGNVIQTFESISEAGRRINISNSNITSVCKGNRKKAGGYGWRYHIEEE